MHGVHGRADFSFNSTSVEKIVVTKCTQKQLLAESLYVPLPNSQDSDDAERRNICDKRTKKSRTRTRTTGFSSTKTLKCIAVAKWLVGSDRDNSPALIRTRVYFTVSNDRSRFHVNVRSCLFAYPRPLFASCHHRRGGRNAHGKAKTHSLR